MVKKKRTELIKTGNFINNGLGGVQTETCSKQVHLKMASNKAFGKDTMKMDNFGISVPTKQAKKLASGKHMIPKVI